MRSNLALVAMLIAAPSAYGQQISQRVLYDFSNPTDRNWRTVNDGVMGGRSVGKFRITPDGKLDFFGTLSLANNGGFASVRSNRRSLNLKTGDVIVARVKGDGRIYSLNLYPPSRRTAFSYRTEFTTLRDSWIEVRAPLNSFIATSYGQRVINARAASQQSFDSIGILLGDKRPGRFELEVAWIRVESTR